MPVSQERRNEYSKQYNFRLAKDEARKLDKRLQDENLTLPEFVRKALGERSGTNAKHKGAGQGAV